MNGKTIGNLILMTLVCVVIFIVFMALHPAGAASDDTNRVPAKLHGHWCVDASTYRGSDASTLVYHRRTGRRCPTEDSDDDNSVEISAQRFDWRGFSCRVTALDNYYDWVSLQCRSRDKFDGKYAEWKSQYFFSFVGKKLFMNPDDK